ncbi:MAG: autotransporter-associated beta strand repeat-containing protein [Alphaproteobacteria bacterium]|nr:autotransporter-associated beta strand repeat-containing protein [Alphaproteobacteria bacterium]
MVTLGSTTLLISDASFSGLISGPGKLQISNTGSAAIFSGANTYSGGTTLSDASVSIGNAGALGSGTIDISNGTLSSTASGTLANDINLGISYCCFSPPRTFLAHLEVAPGQTLTLAGAVQIGGDGAIFGSSSNSGTIVFAPSSASAGTFVKFEVAGGTLKAGNTQLGAVTSAVYGVQVDAGAVLDLANYPTTINQLGGDGQVKIDGATLRLGYSTFAGTIVGTGMLELSNSRGQPTQLLGSNTYAGGTVIDSDAILQLGSGGTSGSIAGNVANSGLFTVNRSDSYTFSSVISGSGALRQSGSGTTILTGANTYTGGTTISSGTLQIGNGGTSGSISGNIVNNATLIFNRSDSVNTFGQVISGTGTLVQMGTGTLTLAGTNTYSGGTIVSAGTLQANNGLGTGDVTINGGTVSVIRRTFSLGALQGGGGTLEMSGSFLTFISEKSTTFAGTIVDSLSGQLTKAGGGILTLTGPTTTPAAPCLPARAPCSWERAAACPMAVRSPSMAACWI